ncbi:MAG: dTDP-4-dehydrorhamnose 3,5-epimerase [Flavobacteriales bacterium]|nr:dTDP-4-dehydrorhamnose 3,5-epimerase [Flavobacteriales bacterium]MBP9079862.1 dTDP-4-dehydrorhamnose 3,5-epimerase [Flavobacteriales bacterium]
MEVFTTAIGGLLRIRPRVFGDPRGQFMETFNAGQFAKATGITDRFVQDNESRSRAGVLRGLHLQVAPHAQAKLVRVVRGAVLDVCVDCRPGSPTYGQHVGIRLDDRQNELLYIPEGMAHGFVALEEETVFSYKCSAYYAPAAERTILWNDPDLAIDWGIDRPLISDKDLAGAPFKARAWAQ